MSTKSEKIVCNLKELITHNGQEYLSDKPYDVYHYLLEHHCDKQISAALLMTLILGIDETAKDNPTIEVLTDAIKRHCCFNQKMASKIAEIYTTLYSPSNMEQWNNLNLKGWNQFITQEITVLWQGESTWDDGSGSVDCCYNATITLKPQPFIKAMQKLADMLSENPYLSSENITKFYIEQLTEYLDSEFNEYCTIEDYYPPVAEDFEIHAYVDKWCNSNDFKLMEIEGKGYTDDYEPHSHYYRY